MACWTYLDDVNHLFVFEIAIKLSISIKKEVNLSKPAGQTITEVQKYTV